MALRSASRTLAAVFCCLVVLCALQAAPAVVRSAPTAPQWPSGTEVIPFEPLEGLILVEARLHGHEGRDTTGILIVDTGAGFLVLDSDVATRIGMSDRRGRDFQLAPRPLTRLELGLPNADPHTPTAARSRTHTLQMDQVSPVMLIGLDPIRRVTDRDVLGLIGERVFHGRAIYIDYGEKFLAILPAAPQRTEADPGTMREAERVASSRAALTNRLVADAVAVPFRVEGDGKIIVRARVSNPVAPRFSEWLTLIVDTGATESALFADVVESLVTQRDQWRTLRGLAAQNLYEPATVEMARVPEIEVEAAHGSVTASDVVFGITSGSLAELLGRSVGEPVHGVLGHSFLVRYKVLIDYPHRVMWLAPSIDWNDRPYEFTHVGIQIERHESQLRVRALAADSPAERKGIRVGDEILEVDNESIAGLDLSAVTRLLEGPQGSIVRVTVRRGKMHVTFSMVRRELL